MQERTMALTDLYEHEGPFTSVLLPLPPGVGDARQQLDIHRRDLRRSLEAAGGDPVLLDEVEVDPAATAAGGAVVVIGVGDQPLVVQQVPEPATDLVRVDTLPVVSPVLAAGQQEIEHLVVLVDRTGATIVTPGDGDGDGAQEVDGDTEHLSRIRGGGWSHRRMQQRAENTWEHNARLVADEVAAAVERSGARLVYVAGDERAVGFLIEHLPSEVRSLVHVDPREPQGLADALGEVDEALGVRLDTIAAEDRADLLRRYSEARGRGEAADGPEETLAALSESRVDLLLVHDDLDEGPRAWFAPGEPLAAPRPEPIADLGRDPVEGRLHDVAIRGAVLTDAEVRVVPGAGPSAPTAGVGALLRWG